MSWKWLVENVIDLTGADSSGSSANHFRLNNEIINLDTDDSFNISDNANARSSGLKKRKKTRTGVPETPVLDLCTPPPVKIQNRKRTRKSKKESENTSIVIQEPTGEPDAKKAKQQDMCCPICFEEFNGQPLASTSCGHVFCLMCIKRAFRRKPQCPKCRTQLKGSSKYHPIFL